MTKFAIGARWRCEEKREAGKEPFDFVIIGPPDKYGNPKTHKMCRLEAIGHDEKCHPICPHGNEQTYSHAHLKKYATRLEDKTRPVRCVTCGMDYCDVCHEHDRPACEHGVCDECVDVSCCGDRP